MSSVLGHMPPPSRPLSQCCVPCAARWQLELCRWPVGAALSCVRLAFLCLTCVACVVGAAV